MAQATAVIKAILLDCFGVLYVPVGEDFYTSHVPNYEKHRDELHELGYKTDMGQITQEQLVQAVAKLSGLELAETRRGVVGQWLRNQTLMDFAQSLRPQYKVGLLTNMSSGAIDRFFSQHERRQLFDDVIVSSEVGAVKPSQHIFMLAARGLDVEPEECLVIDDSTQNCSGAVEAGMQAIAYQSTQQVVAETKRLLKI